MYEQIFKTLLSSFSCCFRIRTRIFMEFQLLSTSENLGTVSVNLLNGTFAEGKIRGYRRNTIYDI